MEKLEKINFIVKGDSLLNEETVILDSLTKLNELQGTYLSEDDTYSKHLYGYLFDHRTNKEFFLYSDATKQKYNFTKDYILSSTTAKNVDGISLDNNAYSFVSVSDNIIDFSKGNFFNLVVTKNITLSVDNLNTTDNIVNMFYLQIKNNNDSDISWFGDIRWENDTLPTFSASNSDLFIFYTYNKGKTWIGKKLVENFDTYIIPALTMAWTNGIFNDTAIRDNGSKVDLYNVSVIDDVLYTYGTCKNIFSSADGITWTRYTSIVDSKITNLGGSTRISSLRKINDKYFAICDDGWILVSTNMITWTGFKPSPIWLKDIVYYDNTYVAFGGANYLVTSPDGLTWTKQSSYSGSSAHFNDLVYFKGTYVLRTENNGVLYSTSLTGPWQAITPISTSVSELISKKFINLGNKLVLLSYTGVHQETEDGINWKPVSSSFNLPIMVSYGFPIKVGDIHGVMESFTGNLYLTKDGENWTKLEQTAVAGTPYVKLFDNFTYYKGKWILVGWYSRCVVYDAVLE